ncbi:nesprin-1-like [Babylonia areolata]|uniref:nesprin-1-like n=1 Tax=Babylonia areolata TaxID=304850 RepID=UPI003FCF2D87
MRHVLRTIQSEFKLQEESFRKLHELGSTLLQRADPSAAQEIKVVTAQVQHAWLEVYNKLEEQRVRLEALQGDWRQCEEDIEEILAWLKNIRLKLNADIPNTYDDLQADLTRCKDIAASFDNSEDKRQRLQALEKKLSRAIQAEDMNVLHQRIRLLNKQWEELRSQAGLRDHRLHDCTFRWSSLGQQLRELMEWIEDMEVRIVSSREVHIEDLLHKLETEYADAMAMKGREVEEVMERGRQLMKNSSEIRASDIEQRLQRLHDKWCHLQAVADFRTRKLKETVLAVKQLESSMRNLSHWLATVEQELAAPVVYHDCDMQEISAKLQHTQDVQRDIEQHSAGVSSVLNLCEVLLHDADACPTQTEFDALQHAMTNLDRRWKNIFDLCPERRARIKETWELWETFGTDCRRFSEWLGTMEVDIGDTEASMPPSGTKEDIRNYENLQRQVHDRLSELESINKQYRQLAKEGRTDTKGVLRSRMQEANDRWDALQQRVTELMQGLRQSAGIREDFVTTRLSLMQWLTEVDMQLTNIEHLSQLDVAAKIKEIQRLEEEIDERRHRMDYLQQAAVLLIQQGTEGEALRVQQELDQFKQFSRQVLQRVDTCRSALHRLSAAQVEETGKVEEKERYAQLECGTDLLTAQRPSSADWDTRELEAYLESSPPESPPYKRRARAEGDLVPKASVSPIRRPVSPARSPSPLLRSGSPVRSLSPTRRSPSPTRSLSPTRRSLSPTRRSVSPSRRSTSPSRWSRDGTDGEVDSEWRARGRSAKIDVLVEQLADAVQAASAHLDIVERQMDSRISADSPPSHREVRAGKVQVVQWMDSLSYICVQCLMECENQVDTVQRLDRLLKIEAGSTFIPSVDLQVKGINERWERVQSRAAERNLRISQQQRDVSRFSMDVDSLLGWLDEAEALQASLGITPTDITHLNLLIRQHKDFMVQLEGKRARFLSIQLLSKNYVSLTTPEGRQLQLRVQELERRWEAVAARAADIQQSLQRALLQCQEFQHTVQDYLLWLEDLEGRIRRCEPVRLSAEVSLLKDKYNILQDLRSELEGNQSAVLSLRETADQLLVSGDLPEMSSARDKTHIISNRLNSLLHLTNAYLQSLESKLRVKGARQLYFYIVRGVRQLYFYIVQGARQLYFYIVQGVRQLYFYIQGARQL